MATASMEIKVTPEIAAEHGVTADEYARIQEILGRDPNITELGIFSVMWSEHCSYKSSKVHLKRLPTRGKLVVQGPGENAGVVDIGDGLVAAFKIESHNHPSYVEPFQGATTGVGGILRDIFTMGARPIAILDSLRFGPSLQSTASRAPARQVRRSHRQQSPHPRRRHSRHRPLRQLFRRAHRRRRSLLRAVLLAKSSGQRARAGHRAQKRDLFFAKAEASAIPSFTSAQKPAATAFTAHRCSPPRSSPKNRSKSAPTCRSAIPSWKNCCSKPASKPWRTGAVVAIQDMGAAGLTCSTSEMASRGGTGIEIDLGRVPQRETGMTPYEIMLSESQERMLLVAEKGREREVLQVFKKWGLDAVVVGEVDRRRTACASKITDTSSPRFPRIRSPKKARSTSARLPRRRHASKPTPTGSSVRARKQRISPKISNACWPLRQLLPSAGSPSNTTPSVRTNTLAVPGASDAAVVRIKETEKNGVLALATDGNGRWCQLNPRLGAMHAVAEAARNVACSGARPIAATNCLNFGSPEKPEVMWQFTEPSTA